MWAHQFIIASASLVFYRLFKAHEQGATASNTENGAGVFTIPGIQRVLKGTNQDGNSQFDVISITLSPEISKAIFDSILEFLYSGSVSSSLENEPERRALRNAASLLEMEHLVTICDNVASGDGWLNPSIGTWLNDETGSQMLRLLGRAEPSQPAVVQFEGLSMHAHMALIKARCSMMAQDCIEPSHSTGRMRYS